MRRFGRYRYEKPVSYKLVSGTDQTNLRLTPYLPLVPHGLFTLDHLDE